MQKIFTLLSIFYYSTFTCTGQIKDNPYLSQQIGLTNEYYNYGSKGEYLGKDQVTLLSSKRNSGATTVKFDLSSFDSKDVLEHASQCTYVYTDYALTLEGVNYALPFVDKLYKGNAAQEIKDSLRTINLDAGCDALTLPMKPKNGETLPGGECDINVNFSGGSAIIHLITTDRKVFIGNARVGCENYDDAIMIYSKVIVSMRLTFGGISINVIKDKVSYVKDYYKKGIGSLQTISYDDEALSKITSYRILNSAFKPHKDKMEYINIHYDVPVFCQETNCSCWATSAAMILSWKNNATVNPRELAYSCGYNEAYDSEGLESEDENFLKRNGFSVFGAASYTVNDYKEMLTDYGPIWITIGPTDTNEVFTHMVVLTAMKGDGSPCGTYLTYNDPWPMDDNPRPGCRGVQTEMTFETLNEEIENMLRMHIVAGDKKPWGAFTMAHLKRKR